MMMILRPRGLWRLRWDPKNQTPAPPRPFAPLRAPPRPSGFSRGPPAMWCGRDDLN